MLLRAVATVAIFLSVAACGQGKAADTAGAANAPGAQAMAGILATLTQTTPPPQSSDDEAPWAICETAAMPVVVVASYPNVATGAVALTFYAKNGAGARTEHLVAGNDTPTPPTSTRALLHDGAQRGAIVSRTDVPSGDQYTEPVSAVRFEDGTYACRWLPRARLEGFDAQHAFWITEGADKSLSFHEYDFASPQQGDQESVTILGGHETFTRGATTFAFSGAGARYVVRLPSPGARGHATIAIEGSHPMRFTLLRYETGPVEDE